MNKIKTILVLALSAAFVISLTSYVDAARPGNPHLTIVETVFDGDDVWIETAFSVNSGAPAAYGYAVLLNNGGFLVIATHAGADDHDRQGNARSPVFHVHYLEAGTGAPDCTTPLKATFENDLDSNLKIKNNMIHVTDIDFSDTDENGATEATGYVGDVFAFTIDKNALPDFVCFTPQ